MGSTLLEFSKVEVLQGHLGKAGLSRHSSSLGLVREPMFSFFFVSKGSSYGQELVVKRSCV